MKLRQAGEPRVNRSARAGEVLRPPEQPHAKPWDPRDPELFSRWLEKAENVDHRQMGYAVFDLSVIAPHLVTSEIRKAIVAGSMARMKHPLEFWQRGRQETVFGLGSFAEDMVPAVLLDPNAQLEVPDKFWAEMHAAVQDSGNWYRNYLRAYALQFPGRLDPRANEIFEHLYPQLERARQRRVNVGHELVATLATIRLVAPGQFAHIQLTQTDQQIIQKYLQKERREVEDADGPWSLYPEELFLAMVALADEVTVSQDKGLQLEFTAPAIAPTPELPERPRF